MRSVLLLLALCVVALNASILNDNVVKQLKGLDTMIQKGRSVIPILNNAGLNPDSRCLLCGIVTNEVWGMLAENETETNIIDFVDKDVCSHLPSSVKGVCDELVALIPDVVTEIENGKSPSVYCVERNYCTVPFSEMPDWSNVPIYEINMDLDPEDRWTEACSNSTFRGVMQNLIGALENFFDDSKAVSDLGKMINELYFPKDYAGELRGCAAALGVDFGWLTLVNLGYEITDACTSIVAQTDDGKVIHARNMDFWDGIWLTGHLKNITMTAVFTSGGNTVFEATTFAGYMGILSGMKPNGWSVSINTRYYPQGISGFFKEFIIAITERNATLVSFLTRDTLTTKTSFSTALTSLSNEPLVADVYYIMAGTQPGEGAVISRNQNNASDVWMLNSPSRWFEVQTNYDHWKQPPWFDDRVKPADSAMNAMGQANATIEGMMKVLSVKPVLNLQSTFSMIAVPADNYFMSYMRNCPYPCAE